MGRVTGSALIKLAVIAVLSSSHVWRICSAQTLPVELQTEGLFPLMRQHFCPMNESYDDYERQTICWNIKHNNNAMQSKCSNSTGRTCMEEDQSLHCSYQDATVCRYDRRGSCIYSDSSSILPFCVCRNEDGLFPTSFSDGDSIQSTCADVNATTQTSSMEATDGAFSGAAPSNPSTTVTPSSNVGTNVAAIAVGVALSFILLLVILGISCLCRSGKLKAVRKEPSKQDDESKSMEIGRIAPNRAQLPEPLVANNLEYSYACGHWPVRPANATTDDPTPVAPAQGGDRYVTDGPGSSSTENGPFVENADVHPYFEVGKPIGHEGSGSSNEVDHTSPRQSPTGGDNHAYYQVYPTTGSRNETPACEEVGKAGTSAQPSAASDPYQQLNAATLEGSAEYQGLKGKADDDDTGDENVASYQHLNRATLKRFNEGDAQKDGSYGHLKGEAAYDVPKISNPKD